MKNSKLHHLPTLVLLLCFAFLGGGLWPDHTSSDVFTNLQRPCPHGSARRSLSWPEFAFSPTPRGALPKLGLGGPFDFLRPHPQPVSTILQLTMREDANRLGRFPRVPSTTGIKETGDQTKSYLEILLATLTPGTCP